MKKIFILSDFINVVEVMATVYDLPGVYNMHNSALHN